MSPAASLVRVSSSDPTELCTVMIGKGAPFSNAGRNLRQIGSAPASWSWIGVILGIQTLVTALGGQNKQPVWLWFVTLGLTHRGFLSGKLWQIFTYGFLHGGWWHAGLNALFILLVGSRIEHMAGRAVMVKATIAGVLGGGIGHLMLSPAGPNAPLLVGLSGGCMGLLLLLTTLSPQSRMMPLPVSGRSLGLGLLAAALILALMEPAMRVPAFSGIGKWLVAHRMGYWFQMGHACHFGGGVAGWLYGRWILRPRVTIESLQRDRERRESVGSKEMR